MRAAPSKVGARAWAGAEHAVRAASAMWAAGVAAHCAEGARFMACLGADRLRRCTTPATGSWALTARVADSIGSVAVAMQRRRDLRLPPAVDLELVVEHPTADADAGATDADVAPVANGGRAG